MDYSPYISVACNNTIYFSLILRWLWVGRVFKSRVQAEGAAQIWNTLFSWVEKRAGHRAHHTPTLRARLGWGMFLMCSHSWCKAARQSALRMRWWWGRVRSASGCPCKSQSSGWGCTVLSQRCCKWPANGQERGEELKGSCSLPLYISSASTHHSTPKIRKKNHERSSGQRPSTHLTNIYIECLLYALF